MISLRDHQQRQGAGVRKWNLNKNGFTFCTREVDSKNRRDQREEGRKDRCMQGMMDGWRGEGKKAGRKHEKDQKM